MKRAKFLKDNDILAVPFDKGTEFCVMKKQSYQKKLAAVLDCTQVQEIASTGNNIAPNFEKDINSALLDMKKGSLLSKKNYQKFRSTGAQPARLHKNRIHLRPVLSIPGTSYYNFNKFLAPLFDKVPCVNIETSTLDARRKLESIKLGVDESLVSLDVRSLYTFVPVNDAIEIALRSLYSSDHAPEMSRSTLKTLLKLAVTNVCFKNHDRWFCQVNGLAMRASLAVTLANIWMKSFENQIKSTKKIINKIPKNGLEACPECNRRVTCNGK